LAVVDPEALVAFFDPDFFDPDFFDAAFFDPAFFDADVAEADGRGEVAAAEGAGVDLVEPAREVRVVCPARPARATTVGSLPPGRASRAPRARARAVTAMTSRRVVYREATAQANAARPAATGGSSHLTRRASRPGSGWHARATRSL
jgi:hypothetical protein